MPNPAQPNAAAARGLMRLPKKLRDADPRAKVQSLVRSAKIADGQAERALRYSGDVAKARILRGRRDDALEACIYLNRLHHLGYPVA